MRRVFLAFAILAGLILSSVAVAAQRVNKTAVTRPRIAQSAVQQDLQRNAIVREAVRVRLPQPLGHP